MIKIELLEKLESSREHVAQGMFRDELDASVGKEENYRHLLFICVGYGLVYKAESFVKKK